MKIIGSNPTQLQLELTQWNRRAVMLAIKQMFGIDMPIRTVGEYFRRWGFTPRRPLKGTHGHDPARPKEWLEDKHPKIVAHAKPDHAEISWGDDTAIRTSSNWVRGHSIAGLKQELRLPAGRNELTSMISAIINQEVVRFSLFEGAYRRVVGVIEAGCEL